MKLLIRPLQALAVASLLTGCTSLSRVFNPFYETPPPEAYLGEKNDDALPSSCQSAWAALTATANTAAISGRTLRDSALRKTMVLPLWIDGYNS